MNQKNITVKLILLVLFLLIAYVPFVFSIQVFELIRTIGAFGVLIVLSSISKDLSNVKPVLSKILFYYGWIQLIIIALEAVVVFYRTVNL